MALKRLMLLAVLSLSGFCLPQAPLSVVAAESPAVVNWLDERPGAQIPLSATFTDSTNQTVTLAQLIDRPTLVVPVYYNCRNVCNLTLGGLAQVLPQVRLKAGEDYRIVTFSIDVDETQAMAAHSKKTFLTAARQQIPADAWSFLVGDSENIHQVTDAAGYRFEKKGEDFLHPVAAFVVSGEGKIVRYLNGYTFAPLDINMALLEAAEGRISAPIRKTMQFCFSYDPVGRRYTFNLLRVSATVILLTLGTFLLYLIFGGRKKKS